jgi:hypothetical protein
VAEEVSISRICKPTIKKTRLALEVDLACIERSEDRSLVALILVKCKPLAAVEADVVLIPESYTFQRYNEALRKKNRF